MESSLSYTFQDLYLDVLEYSGVGRDTTDTDIIAKAKRRVNDAYRKFLVLDWEFLTKFTTLNIISGTDTYELPDNFGVMRTPFKCSPNTVYKNPEETVVSKIWEMKMYSPQYGTPIYYTFKSDYDVSRGVRTSVVFYPIPNQGIIYNYSYKLITNELVNDGDIPFCPPNLSHVIREFCLAEVELYEEEGANGTHNNHLYNVLLPQAIQENSIRTPNTVGLLNATDIVWPIGGTKATINGTNFIY